MNLKEIIKKIELLKKEVNELRPLDKEQEGRLMQKIRLDWNYHSNNIERVNKEIHSQIKNINKQ